MHHVTMKVFSFISCLRTRASLDAMNLDQGTESLHTPDFSKQLTEIQDKGCTLRDEIRRDLTEMKNVRPLAGCTTLGGTLDDWLTVHRSITLFDLQLDAQNSYLFTYNTFIKILYMFRALPCSSSGGLRRNCIYAASGIVTL